MRIRDLLAYTFLFGMICTILRKPILLLNWGELSAGIAYSYSKLMWFIVDLPTPPEITSGSFVIGNLIGHFAGFLNITGLIIITYEIFKMIKC